MTTGQRLDGLIDARAVVANGSTLDDVCHRTVEGVEEFLTFDACELYLEEAGTLVCEAASEPETGAGIDRTVASRAYRSRESLLIDDATEDERVEAETGYRSVLAVPLGEYGALQLADEQRAAFDDRSLALADLFGGYVTQTLETVRNGNGSPEAGTGSSLPSDLTDQVLEAADVMLLALDRSGKITFANRKTREILGYDTGDLVGCNWLETCIPERNRDHVREVFEQLIAGEVEPVDHYENPVLTRDGEERVVEWHNIVLRNEDGAITGTLSSGLDVTEQRCRERELEAVNRQYRALLRAAPEPIFVADADTGEIIEANAAAADIRGQSREELVGIHQTELHPAGETEQYREGFEQNVEKRGSFRELPDGTQLKLVTDRGETIPVEINVDTVELPDRRVVFGIFRDISDQIEYEKTIAGLSDAASHLFTDEVQAVAENFVRTTTALPGFDSAAVYRYDENAGRLQLVRPSPESSATAGTGQSVIEPGESTAWRVFVDGETTTVADSHGGDDVLCSGTQSRSELLVPVGEHGLVVVGQRDRETFDDRTIQLVEILGATVEAAFDAIERQEELETREQQHQQRTEQLERVERINRGIRELAGAIAGSEGRDAVERTVCEQVLDTEGISFAWIGERDANENVVQPRVRAGDGAGYLRAVDRSLDGGSEPAASAVSSRQPVTIQNAATRLSSEPWRDEAVRRGFQSVLALPIVYQHTTLGVLGVYASHRNAFDELLQSALTCLCDLLAHAIVTTARKQAMYEDATTELEFEIDDPTCFFSRFAGQTGCTIELERIVPEPDGTWRVFVTLDEQYRESCLERARTAPEIERANPVGTDDGLLLELYFSEPFLVSKLANYGIVVRNVTADRSRSRVTITVPSNLSASTAADVMSAVYPGSQLLAKRHHSQSAPTESARDQGLDGLTSRQREVLEAAYRCGYFESPKDATGSEVAEQLGLSTSAFHDHLRAAERTLVGTEIDGGDPDAVDRPSDPGAE